MLQAETGMLQLRFTEEEIKELDYQRYHHPHPRVQRKMEALLLKAKGLPHHQIANCVGVCENTLRDYLHHYRDLIITHIFGKGQPATQAG